MDIYGVKLVDGVIFKMDANEINKTIAEYMGKAGYRKVPVNIRESELIEVFGYKWDIETVPIEYTESLDALVPVWEKIDNTMDIKLKFYGKHMPECMLYNNNNSNAEAKTIQFAAAYATAKAIKELLKE